MRYSTLLIDFDGTLFDTRNAIRLTLAELAARRGVAAFDSVAVDAVIDQGLPLTDMLRVLLFQVDAPDLDVWIADYRQIYNAGLGISESSPYPGVENVLRSLYRNGIEMFIVSNKGEASIMASLEYHHLRSYFREVIAAVGELPPKPDPTSFVKKIKPLIGAGNREQVLVVGDTEVDISYARNIGAASCWAAYGYGQAESCEVLTPHFVIQTPEDLLRFII
jgi:phosphoglycolate phosphatase